MRMINVQWSNPVSCIRTGRLGHKRVDSETGDETVSKCSRLSESPGDAALLGSSPGSPLTPVPLSSFPTQQGPSRIGQFLLLPMVDRDMMHSALNIDTRDELVCKEFDLRLYQEKIRAYSVLPVHRNIACIRDIVLGERQAYVFLDKGHGDMHTLVKSCKRLSEGHAARLFHQVASAVAHCHQHGVVLGDLKLRKFVFSNEERTRVKLEGLDACHVLGGDDSLSETHGCPAYVSPEILNGPGSYSGKQADIWSLGVMLYTMLVGRYPFHDPDPAALFSKIRRGQCCLPEDLSPRAKCLLRSLLRKDPWDRLTAAEVLIHPWFAAATQETAASEQEVALAEQEVPSFDAEEESNLFC
ncbi:tribbles homolog 1 [Esox lucius]|uniref:Protein kinase domain-containing protein n=1 Tax=Esox lucius TaxID=8010 RepID=A0A3P8YLL4_ESOLU|nr:tribbles homolog 1 [Esox lucius]